MARESAGRGEEQCSALPLAIGEAGSSSAPPPRRSSGGGRLLCGSKCVRVGEPEEQESPPVPCFSASPLYQYLEVGARRIPGQLGFGQEGDRRLCPIEALRVD